MTLSPCVLWLQYSFIYAIPGFDKYLAMFNYDVLYCGDANNCALYGLYEPIGDLFLVVGSDLKFLQQFALLFSSRYILYTCDISAAKNYTENIISNAVCVNWSISNRDSFAITRFPNLNNIIAVDYLVEKPKTPPWNFSNDQAYALLAYYYLTVVVPDYENKAANFDDQLYPKPLSTTAIALRDTLAALPGAPIANRFKAAIEQIRNILYSEFDVNAAKQLLAKATDV